MSPTPLYADASLGALANLLSSDFYNTLEALLHQYSEDAKNTKGEEEQGEATPALKELKAQLAWRLEILKPYLASLSSKQETAHNCSECSGKCDMQHILRLKELEDGHQRFLLQLPASPLVSIAERVTKQGAPLPDARALRILATAIEMVHAEVTYLIPNINQARKDIHADANGEVRQA